MKNVSEYFERFLIFLHNQNAVLWEKQKIEILCK